MRHTPWSYACGRKMVPSFLTDKLVVASVLGVTVATIGVVWWYITRGGRSRKTPGKLVFRPVGKLSDIWIHPVKSCRGYQVTSAEVTPVGFSSDGVFDRHFIVLSETNTFVTMRQEPSLALLQPTVTDNGQRLVLEAPGMDPLTIDLSSVTGPDRELIHFGVWRITGEGLNCGKEAEAWLSSYLKKPGQKLVFFKPGVTKARKPAEDSLWGSKFRPGEEVFGFQDLAPLLVITEASLDDLNSRLEKPVTMRNLRTNLVVSGTGAFDEFGFQDLAPLLVITEASLDDLNSRLEKPVTMRNLRTNLVVSGTGAFDEDQWKYMRVGDSVILRNTYVCGRCKLTTVDPQTGVLRSDGEPLSTLKTYRMLDNSDPDSKTLGGAPVCGAKLACETYGTISVGDTVYASV